MLFFGSDEFSLKLFQKVLVSDSIRETVEVVTPPGNIKAKFGQVNGPLQQYCQDIVLPVHSAPPKSLKDWQIPKGIHGETFDVGVVVSFGYFIPQRIINSFSKGMINIHPSLLPMYRGASPLQYTILNSDRVCGTTIQELSPTTFDAGRILKQTALETPERPTYEELIDFIGDAAGNDMVEVLANLTSYRENATLQDESKVTYAPKFDKQAGHIQWSKQSAEDIYRLYRAIGTRIPLFTTFKRKKTFILNIRDPEDLSIPDFGVPGAIQFSPDDELLHIQASKGVISADIIHVQSKSPIMAHEFYNGYAVKGKISPFTD